VINTLEKARPWSVDESKSAAMCFGAVFSG
jgi:hypothetical protein